MTDIFTPEKRSWVMSRIRGTNTKIDLKMKKMLEENKIKFVMYPKMYGNPDFVLKRKKIIIYCDGDFWHGYKYSEKKKPSKKYWKDKIEGNMRRDKRIARKLRSEGWSVLRFWEHDIEKNPDKCMRRLAKKGKPVLNKKISDTFSMLEKTFSKKSKPVYLNQNAEPISLKQIHEIESVGGKPISMIAVTRHQYDTCNFSKYKSYIKKELKLNRIYYGLWSDGKKSEWDVLYAIPTDDPEQIQNHLNAHNRMNQGIAQVMALIIDSNGKDKVLKNSTCL